MANEFFDFAPAMTAWEIDHLADPEDDAEKLVELLEERVAEAQLEVCEFCEQPRCVCEPISMREYRAMAARYDGSPLRVVRR